jgi:O-antigen/teichoic acid export membrane protein
MSHTSTSATSQLWSVILRNTAFASASRILIKLANFATGIFTARMLGEIAFGQFATVTTFVGMFSVFFELGLAQYVQRSIAQDRSKTSDLLATLVTLRLLLALAGIVALTGGAAAIGHPPIIVLGVFLLTLTFLPAAILMPLATVVTANERFDLMAGVEIVSRLLTILLTIGVLLAGFGIIGLLCTGFVVMPIQIAICLYTIRRYRLGNIRLKFAPHEWPAFIRAALPFGLTSLALTFNFNADSVILSRTHPAEVVGWYNLAYGFIFSIVAISDGFLTSMTPSLAREHTSNPGHVQAWTQTSLKWLALFALPASIGTWLLAEPIIATLYGERFAPSGALFALLAWDVPLLLFISFCGNLTSAIGLEKPAARIYLAATFLNVSLNLWLIPRYGAQAAALITVATDTISSLLFLGLIAKRMQLNTILAMLVRIIVAVGCMGAVVWNTQHWPLLIPITLGAMSYLAAATLVGAYDRTVVHAIISRFRRT